MICFACVCGPVMLSSQQFSVRNYPPQVHPPPRRQVRGAGDDGAADRADVLRAGPGQERRRQDARLRRLLLKRFTSPHSHSGAGAHEWMRPRFISRHSLR